MIKCKVAYCVGCKRVYKFKRKEQKYCSNECAGKHISQWQSAEFVSAQVNQKKKDTIECIGCGALYHQDGTKQKYCSVSCCSKHCIRKPKPKKEKIRHCITCGDLFYASLSGHKKHCCKECKRKKCLNCGLSIDGAGKKYCNWDCWYSKFVVDKRLLKNEQLKVCEECGKAWWNTLHPFKKYCSKKCNERVGKRTRRARLKNVFVEPVYLIDIIKRDGCICGICKQPVDMTLKAPHLMSPTIDHVIAIANGGEHSLSNCQLAHFSCNSRKGAKE